MKTHILKNAVDSVACLPAATYAGSTSSEGNEVSSLGSFCLQEVRSTTALKALHILGAVLRLYCHCEGRLIPGFLHPPAHPDIFRDKSMEASTVKLIQGASQSGVLEVTEGGAQTLGGTGVENYVAIIGPLRTGKSLLIDYLNGSERTFRAHNGTSCTKGVDMPPESLPFADFAHRFGGTASSGSPAIRFLDVEGAGDMEKKHDLSLYVSVLLISKACIFNVKGFAGKADFLDSLGTMALAGSIIDQKSGSPGSKPFGHLHVVLRDFQYDSDRGEYERYLLEPEPGLSPEVRDRNSTRQLINQSFESIQLYFFKTPPSRLTKNTQRIPFSDISVFGEDLEKLAKSLTAQLQSPSSMGFRAPLTGIQVVAVLKKTLAVFAVQGENAIIPVPDLVVAMYESMANATLELFRKSLDKHFAGLKLELPMRQRDLGKRTHGIIAALTTAYHEKAPKDDIPDLKTKYENLLHYEGERFTDSADSANKAARDLKLSEATAKCAEDIKESLESALSAEGKLPTDNSTIESLGGQAYAGAKSAFEKAVGWVQEDEPKAYETKLAFLEASMKEQVNLWITKSNYAADQQLLKELMQDRTKNQAKIQELQQVVLQTKAALEKMESDHQQVVTALQRRCDESKRMLEQMTCDAAASRKAIEDMDKQYQQLVEEREKQNDMLPLLICLMFGGFMGGGGKGKGRR